MWKIENYGIIEIALYLLLQDIGEQAVKRNEYFRRKRDMAKKQTETIKQIQVDTQRLKDGHIKTKTALLFESGMRYATSILGFDQRFDKFAIGDKVLVTIDGSNVLQVQEA